MPPGDGFETEGERVVVGVSKDSSCKDAIKWAIANTLKSPDDILILLHVVTKIPSPCMYPASLALPGMVTPEKATLLEEWSFSMPQNGIPQKHFPLPNRVA